MKEQLVAFVNSKAGAIAASLHVPVVVVQGLLLLALLVADAAGYGSAGEIETSLAGTLAVGALTSNVSWLVALMRRSILEKPDAPPA